MKVLGIIPARYASSRFPGKPLIDLKGKSMIQRVYEGATKSALVDTVIVATDDQRIFDTVKAFGGKVMLTRADHLSGTDRCAEVASQLDSYDIILNIQGDEPLVDSRQLDDLLDAFQDSTVSIATLGNTEVSQEDLSNPNRIKVVKNGKGDALYFSRSSIPNTHHAAGNTYPFMRHIGLYAYKRNTLLELTKLEPTILEKTESLEQLRWLYHGYSIRIVNTTIETPNIDVPEDVEKVLQLL